jgi:hypothetical protein
MVLADLMRRPADGRSAVARIPAEMFTAGPLRALYAVISARIVAGEPVDPVIIAWEASQGDQAVVAGDAAAARWSLPAIALKIGETPTAVGTARVFGRALLADHVLTERFGAGWAQERELGSWLGAAGPGTAEQSAGSGLGPDPGRVRGRQLSQGTAPSGARGGPAWEPVPGAAVAPGWGRPEPGSPGADNGAVPRR